MKTPRELETIAIDVIAELRYQRQPLPISEHCSDANIVLRALREAVSAARADERRKVCDRLRGWGFTSIAERLERLAVGGPSKQQVVAAKQALQEEYEAREKRLDTTERRQIEADTARRVALPSEHPDHIHGVNCDGQDGASSYETCRICKIFR